LTDLKFKIPKKEQALATDALLQYQHLLTNAKGIANFNMVWRQYQLLFEELALWAPNRYPNIKPIFNSLGEGLNLPWQQYPQKLLEMLEEFSHHLFFIAHFEKFKPTIRTWMESWFFLQRTEMRKLEADDQLLIKERNYTQSMLDKLLRFRKSNLYLLSIPEQLSVLHGNTQAA
jgi:hypothetical protein